MKQYQELLKHVLANGEEHNDRTGVGTLSVFGYQFRHNMQEGFPLLTTKKLPFRWIAEELFWFLRGSTIDQIDRLMGDIRDNPNSRRHIVTGWDPAQCDKVALPPCHTLWQIKCHSNRQMSLHLYARSIDSFLGLPFNIASYALLLTLIAVSTGYYKPKELVISFGDVHIYKNHISQVEEQI